MSEPALHFSLRSLFTATTLIAILGAAIAVHPAVWIASLVLLSPVLFVVAMATFANHASASQRAAAVIVGSALVVFGARTIFMASQFVRRESWIPGGMIIALGAAFYTWAWTYRTPDRKSHRE